VRRSTPLTFWIRAVEAAALAVAVCFSLGATDASSRFNDLGHRLMCTCGCAQMLGECNHVGCPESGRERKRTERSHRRWKQRQGDSGVVRRQVRSNRAGRAHYPWFRPGGLDCSFAVFAAALLGTILLVRRWANLSWARRRLPSPTRRMRNPGRPGAAGKISPGDRHRRRFLSDDNLQGEWWARC